MSTPRLSILADLHEYATANDAANASLKKCVWQITKIRRKQNRGIMSMEETFSPDQIRVELLRARTLVRDRNNDEPPHGLIAEQEEGMSLPSSSIIGSAPEWESVDALEILGNNKENPSSSTGPSSIESIDASSGLRQRKKGNELRHEDATSSSNKSTVQNNNNNTSKMTEDVIVGEEEMLLQRDPLELFSGVRPGDLKVAQQHAKAALDSYIEAANRAAQILHQLNTANQPTEK